MLILPVTFDDNGLSDLVNFLKVGSLFSCEILDLCKPNTTTMSKVESFPHPGNQETEVTMDDDVDEYSKLHSVQGNRFETKFICLIITFGKRPRLGTIGLDRGQSPVEWRDFPSVRPFVRMSPSGQA